MRQDLTNKVVLIKRDILKEGIEDRRFLCEGGFGCHPFTNGTKIFGKWLSDDMPEQLGGYDVECLFEEKKTTSPEVV